MKIDKENLRLYSEFSPRRGCLDFWLYGNFKDENGKSVKYVATDLNFKLSKELEIAEPFLSIPKHIAQNLIDDLYNAGFRPTIETETANGITATNKHLQDMRTIAAHYGKFKLE